MNVFITLAALLKTLLPKKKLATWKSPDRGITASSDTEEKPDPEKIKPVWEAPKVTYEDIKVSRLMQAFSADPANEDGTSPLVEGTVENPIINSNSKEHIEDKVTQRPLRRIAELVLTVVAWIYIVVYWVFMIVGIIRDARGLPVVSFWIYNQETIRQTKEFFLFLILGTLVEIAVLLLWKEYNKLRFGRKQRRKFKEDVKDSEIDEYFDLSEELRNTMHNEKYIILNENPIPDGIGQGRRQSHRYKIQPRQK